jgi:RND family efflux transporter MFP subunit
MRRCYLATLLLATACGTDHAPKPAPAVATREVRVARAELTRRPTIQEVVGTVRAVRSATIAATLGATVAEVRITVGSAVRPGEVLVRLSAREIDARLTQAKAVYALAKLDRDRAAKLYAEAAISTAQYDAALAQFGVAEAAQAEAGTLSEHAILRAPFAGVVTTKLVNVGDTAMPGQPLLVVEAPDALRFEARVPDALARGLAIGQRHPVRVDGLDHELVGTVGEIDPAADPATRTLFVKLDLPRDPALRSGRFGRLILASGATDAVTVAATAIVRRGQLETVFVVDDGVARLRLVRTAREHDGAIEVVAGLAGGEAVALSDVAQLVDGQRVEARP